MNYAQLFSLAKEKSYELYFQHQGNENENSEFLEICLIQKWLRDKHGIEMYVVPDRENYHYSIGMPSDKTFIPILKLSFKSYDEAILEGCFRALQEIEPLKAK